MSPHTSFRHHVDRVPGGRLQRRVRAMRTAVYILAGMGAIGPISAADHQDDQETLAKLDMEYQKAVERNDTRTMARILADDFILVLGDGTTLTKDDLLKDASSGKTKYQHQADFNRAVRVWGDTAVVTAKLWLKGLEDGKQVDYCQWFSDTYVRKPTGWSYVFGQASLALPKCSG